MDSSVNKRRARMLSILVAACEIFFPSTRTALRIRLCWATLVVVAVGVDGPIRLSSYCDWAEKKKRRHEHVSSWIDMIQLWAFHPVEIPAARRLFSFSF